MWSRKGQVCPLTANFASLHLPTKNSPRVEMRCRPSEPEQTENQAKCVKQYWCLDMGLPSVPECHLRQWRETEPISLCSYLWVLAHTLYPCWVYILPLQSTQLNDLLRIQFFQPRLPFCVWPLSSTFPSFLLEGQVFHISWTLEKPGWTLSLELGEHGSVEQYPNASLEGLGVSEVGVSIHYF